MDLAGILEKFNDPQKRKKYLIWGIVIFVGMIVLCGVIANLEMPSPLKVDFVRDGGVMGFGSEIYMKIENETDDRFIYTVIVKNSSGKRDTTEVYHDEYATEKLGSMAFGHELSPGDSYTIKCDGYEDVTGKVPKL